MLVAWLPSGLLAQRRMSVENGLTDYSLDGFDVPPELPAEQHHQQAGQDAQQQLEQQRPSQHGGMAEAAPAQEQGQQHAATPPQPSASQGERGSTRISSMGTAISRAKVFSMLYLITVLYCIEAPTTWTALGQVLTGLHNVAYAALFTCFAPGSCRVSS